MSQPRWRKVSAPAQTPTPPPRVPLTTQASPAATARRSRGGGGDETLPEAAAGPRCSDASVDVPAHALFLRHRGPKLSDCGVYEGDDEAAANMQVEQRRSSGDLQKMKAKKKSIGDKFSFLSRRSGDAEDKASPSIRAIRPSAEQVQRWGSSFDSLLTDKYGLALFRAFLKTEYSDENIEFWIACEEYRSLAGQKKQTQRAQKIYSEFVAFQAPREVNLDSTTRLATINAMGSPDCHLFEQAQKRIQALMEKDSYQRFLRSEVYQSLLRDRPSSESMASASATPAAPSADEANCHGLASN